MSANVGFDNKHFYYLREFKGTDKISAFLLPCFRKDLNLLCQIHNYSNVPIDHALF